jgi:nitrogen fixation/metabolism regulation signal transduction histidine kinase
MSFRNLSLIFITLLLTSVLLLQWWSISSFSEKVSQQIGESAFEVSRSTAETLIIKQPKMQFRSFAFKTNQQLNQQQVNQLFSNIKQDVHIELHNEQDDTFMLLKADGTEYQIPIPRTGIHLALDDFSNKVLYSTLVLLLLGVLLATYFIHKITSPLTKLQLASNKIGSGEFGTQIEKDNQWHSQEIDRTIESFNQMSSQISMLQLQNKALQDKAHLSELAEVARGLAHTIRNPLNTLNLAIDELQSIQNQADHNEQKQKLTTLAKHQISRIDKWVRSLMDVMSNNQELIQTVDLITTIQHVIDDLKLSIAKPLIFEFIKPLTEAKIIAIHSELRGLLQSLIANAVEASPENGKIKIELRISDTINSTNTNYEVNIIDQGIGFSDKVLANLFSPHNTNKTYGAGMGLYLAERIIRHQYSGKIVINNITDNDQINGSSVTIHLSDRAHELNNSHKNISHSKNNGLTKSNSDKNINQPSKLDN